MSVPVLHTFVVGEVATASNIDNNTVTAVGFLLAPPRVQLRQTVVQSLANNTHPAITFDTEDIDSDNAHSTVTNTSRVTPVTTGWWRCSGAVGYAGNATGRRAAQWALNGTALNGGQILIFSGGGNPLGIPAVTRDIFVNGTTDFIELFGFQDSGAALNTDVGAQQALLVAAWAASP